MILSHSFNIKVNNEVAIILGHITYAASKLYHCGNYERTEYKKLGFEKMKDVDMTPIKKSEAIVQQPIVEESPKVEAPTNSIFKKKSSTPNQQNTLNFNNPGMYGNMFGQNPMMGMPGMGMMKPTASMNMDDLCLGDIINPFSSYY